MDCFSATCICAAVVGTPSLSFTHFFLSSVVGISMRVNFHCLRLERTGQRLKLSSTAYVAKIWSSDFYPPYIYCWKCLYSVRISGGGRLNRSWRYYIHTSRNVLLNAAWRVYAVFSARVYWQITHLSLVSILMEMYLISWFFPWQARGNTVPSFANLIMLTLGCWFSSSLKYSSTMSTFL